MRANKKMEMIIVALLNNAKKPQVKDAQQPHDEEEERDPKSKKKEGKERKEKEKSTPQIDP